MTDDMPLWIGDSGVRTARIEAGVSAARALLAERAVTAQQACGASLARAEGRDHNEAHAAAWDAAEIAALNASGAGDRASLTAG